MVWLPVDLHPVGMRLARADELPYRLGEVALAWSRGPGEEGVLTIQVERRPGFYDVEVTSIRSRLIVEGALPSNSAIARIDNYRQDRERCPSARPCSAAPPPVDAAAV